jgi:chaperonin GroES
MQEQLNPLFDRVVVKRYAADDKSEGGILLPDSAKRNKNKGIVLSVGPGIFDDHGQRIPVDLKPGDIVLFNDNTGREAVCNGEIVYIFRQPEILCTVTKESKNERLERERAKGD